MKHVYAVATGVVSLISIAVILHTTNPTGVGPVGVLALFLCVYIVATAMFYGGILGLKAILLRFHRGVKRVNLEEISHVKIYYYASVAGLVPVILLGAQSIGGVSAWDVVLLFLFVGLSWFYVYKRF